MPRVLKGDLHDRFVDFAIEYRRTHISSHGMVLHVLNEINAVLKRRGIQPLPYNWVQGTLHDIRTRESAEGHARYMAGIHMVGTWKSEFDAAAVENLDETTAADDSGPSVEIPTVEKITRTTQSPPNLTEQSVKIVPVKPGTYIHQQIPKPGPKVPFTMLKR